MTTTQPPAGEESVGADGRVDVGRAAAAELLATFAFVFVAAGAAVASALGLDRVGVALASGLALAVATSVAAGTSGGNVNPAVTIGLWLTGRLRPGRALAHLGAQLVGAAAAGLLLRGLLPGVAFDAAAGGAPALGPGVGGARGLLIEAATTFLLVFAYFGVLVDERGPGASTGGLLVGLVVVFDVLAFAPYSGAAANPARWFGPAFASGVWTDGFVWIVGPIAGGALAALLYEGVFLRGRR